MHQALCLQSTYKQINIKNRMKNKKKTYSTVEKQPQNKPRTIKTSDGKEFKVMDSLLMKYSLFLKSLIEDQKSEDQTFPLPEVDSESFEIMNEFMQMHKDKQPSKIELPLKSNQSLRLVLDEGDATLVEKVLAKGDEFYLKVLQTTSLLQIEQLKKRLIAGLAIKLMKTTVGQLQKQYGLQKYDIKDEQIKEEAQTRLKNLYQMKEEA